MAKIKWVQGDNAPDQTFIITKNGTALNLTGYTVNFNIGPVDSLAKINAGHSTCTITDAANGKVTYSLQATDTATAGNFAGQIEVIDGSGKIQTYTKNIDIEIVQQVN